MKKITTNVKNFNLRNNMIFALRPTKKNLISSLIIFITGSFSYLVLYIFALISGLKAIQAVFLITHIVIVFFPLRLVRHIFPTKMLISEVGFITITPTLFGTFLVALFWLLVIYIITSICIKIK